MLVSQPGWVAISKDTVWKKEREKKEREKGKKRMWDLIWALTMVTLFIATVWYYETRLRERELLIAELAEYRLDTSKKLREYSDNELLAAFGLCTATSGNLSCSLPEHTTPWHQDFSKSTRWRSATFRSPDPDVVFDQAAGE